MDIGQIEYSVLQLVKLINVNRAKSITNYGTLYIPGAIISVKMKEAQDDDILFQSTLIKDIYIYKHHKFLIGPLIKHICCCPHIRANKVKLTEQCIVCCPKNLYCHGVLHLMEKGSDFFLIEKDNRISTVAYEQLYVH